MPGMILERREALARQKQLDAWAPKAGHPSPDFELSDPDGQNPVRLSDFRGHKPAELEAAIEAYRATAQGSPT